MASLRKVLFAFLASPSDLDDERKIVRQTVNELNSIIAHQLGYQIQVCGWEDTVPGFGRPQELINRDSDQCDLFIGMIWKRWGTPPDHNGTFTSGFHEEFVRAQTRREISETPEIFLFLKEISGDLVADPGEELKQVLAFHQQLVEEKKFLFREFSTPQQLETAVRRCIADYLFHRKQADEASERDEVREKPAKSQTEGTEIQRKTPISPLLSSDSLTFLADIVTRIGQEQAPDIITSSDVARFRLIANMISKPNNHTMNLGVHDINLLFEARAEGLELGTQEKIWLSRLAFRFLRDENVPLWCWYSDLLDTRGQPSRSCIRGRSQ